MVSNTNPQNVSEQKKYSDDGMAGTCEKISAGADGGGNIEQNSDDCGSLPDINVLTWFGHDVQGVLNNAADSLGRVLKPEELYYVSFFYRWGAYLAEMVNARQSFVESASKQQNEMKALQKDLLTLKSREKQLRMAIDKEKERNIELGAKNMELLGEIDRLKTTLAEISDDEPLEVNYG